MCEYFATIGLNLSKKFTANQLSNFKIYTAVSLQIFILLGIVENEVACVIDNIKTNPAPGPDGIPPKFIKMVIIVLVPVLTKLYNKCLEEKCFPDDFKISNVIPILKQLHPKNWVISAYISFKYSIYSLKYLKKY